MLMPADLKAIERAVAKDKSVAIVKALREAGLVAGQKTRPVSSGGKTDRGAVSPLGGVVA
jgi:hypothetical protein